MTWFVNQEIPGVIRSSKYNIGYWAWELDTFPEDWVSNLKHFDEIWCPSLFVERSIKNARGYNGTTVRVLPAPLVSANERAVGSSEAKEFVASLLSGGGEPFKPFVFLASFDFNGFKERKNPSAAIRAFLDAFPSGEDADGRYKLLVKSINGHDSRIDALRKLAGGDPRVVFVGACLSVEENDALHGAADCHVSLHGSEGYGMNVLELLGGGMPAVATNYGGNVDFFGAMPDLEGECAFPVPYEPAQIERAVGPYKKGNGQRRITNMRFRP